MRDKDLSDDQLKLVRYKILFVKRDYETAFPEKEELVPDNMTGEAFSAWKVAEFIQQLPAKRTLVPSDWRKGDKAKYPERPSIRAYNRRVGITGTTGKRQEVSTCLL